MTQGTLAFPGVADLVKRLRERRQKSATEYTEPTALELEAAGQIESLVYQLGCRIEKASP